MFAPVLNTDSSTLITEFLFVRGSTIVPARTNATEFVNANAEHDCPPPAESIHKVAARAVKSGFEPRSVVLIPAMPVKE